MTASPECPCLSGEATFTDFTSLIEDESLPTGGFEIAECKLCRRIWLKLRYEIESISRSGRWFSGVIPEDLVPRVTAGNVIAILESLPWHLCGGSYFEGTLSRRTGRLLL